MEIGPWIDIQEKIPDPDKSQQVICYCEDKSQEIATFCRDTEQWYAGGWESSNYCGGRSRLVFRKATPYRTEKGVTHWMPISKPPKE